MVRSGVGVLRTGLGSLLLGGGARGGEVAALVLEVRTDEPVEELQLVDLRDVKIEDT